MKEAAKAFEDANPERAGHMVWMSCEGENPADVENIGKINYYPRMGIPTYYFPYKNQKGYKSPIMFAHLENPKSKNTIDWEYDNCHSRYNKSCISILNLKFYTL